MTLPLESIMRTAAGEEGNNRSYDTWYTPSTDRPTLVFIASKLNPGGTSAAINDLEVDESGGTTKDYDFRMRNPAGLGVAQRSRVVVLVPGASYRVNNVQDPDGGNQLLESVEVIV